MPSQLFNVDREFVEWFYNDPYPEDGSNRYKVYGYGNPANKECMDYWMREAFKQGARAMWQDINLTLLQYATACEGLDPEMVEPCEVFDRARENLHSYVEQLELFK